ncbi:MAG: dihydrodipicolinate synthase family protein [Planctomycetes bacterium]|nr:dihydrodipicolinate synthase family protein [Planctomycetota bacterium]
MKNSFSLHGVIVPLVTPFDDQNQIDFAGLRKVVDFVVGKGVHAVMVGGTTGEGMLLSVGERKMLLEAVVNQVNGKIPVIAHTGCIDTGSTVELTQHASLAGADFISAIVPYFFTLSDDQIYRHFMAVAEAAPIMPMLLYVFPGNAKNDISPALLERLLKAAPNIVGIKSSNDDLIRFQDYVKTGGKGFTACFGVDELMLGGLVFGSQAQISGNANSFPEPFVQLYEAFQAGNIQLAQELQAIVNDIVVIHRAGRTPAFFKATFELRGIPAGRVRPPMCELTAEELEEVRKEVVELLDLIKIQNG